MAVTACGAESRSYTFAVDSVLTIAGLADTSQVRVSVAGDTTRMAGRYSIRDGAVVFRPAFPFDSGRNYEVRIGSTGGAPSVHGFSLPPSNARPSTRVAAVYPAGDTVPENLLRVYIEFSAPMSRDGGLPFVRLLDAAGQEVKGAFLPLDASFWNGDHTRYTLFLDPGRVKRGILPNEQMGRALVAGERYSIVVDSTWRDGRGQPLVASHARSFTAGAADFARITPNAWRLTAPRAGTREPLVIDFNEPLDRGLLLRAIGVETGDGMPFGGDVAIPQGERQWRFVPRSEWPAGNHQVIVLDFLEDLAGNRVHRAFEVDLFERADSTTVPSRMTLPFRAR